MSCRVNLQALPVGVLRAVCSSENLRGRSSVSSVTSLSFPKSRSALWDGSAAGEKLRLQLCCHRKPRLLLLEKALRLAQRHARHSNKPHLHCFFLGSLTVDADEEGVTVTLDRFDPGRDQPGFLGRVPSALLPGDVLVPCLFSTQTETAAEVVVQSEAEFHHSFKVLQQVLSSRQTLDMSQMIKVRGCVVCCQQTDSASFSLSWSFICPSVHLDVQPVRAIPVIPTALLRSLTSVGRTPSQSSGCKRGFLTMDQTRKLLLLLESDPKASTLPLVGVWLSGVTHVYNPQVWAWCVRFLFSSALLDRVFTESCCFLLVVFGSTHRAPQFFQCQGPGAEAGAQLDYQLLTASQCVTLYQVASVEGRTLRCELDLEDEGRQMVVFQRAQSSFSSTAPTAGLSINDQDSGVEDEDLSPRPSPSPHHPAPQVCRVQPSVPELSLLIDSSFTSNHGGPAHRAPPSPAADRKSALLNSSSASKSSPPAPPHHSTPNPNLQQPCSCCPSRADNCTSIFSSPGLPPAQPPAAACPSLQAAPPPHSHNHTPPANYQTPPPFSLLPAPATPSHSHHTPAPPPSAHPHYQTLPPSGNPHSPPASILTVPLSSQPHTPPRSSSQTAPLPSAPPVSCSPSPLPSSHHHTPPPCTPLSSSAVPWCVDSCSPLPFCAAPPSCVNPCCGQVGGVVPADTYHLLLQQDRQLRLLQAQVQMLLEAQGKLQSSRQQQEEPPRSRSTVSIAVETGASLFWEDATQPLPHQEAPPTSSPTLSSSHSLPHPLRPPSCINPPVTSAMGRVEDADITSQEAVCSPSSEHSQPVVTESVGTFAPADDQDSFYQDLMNQLTSRLQEPDCGQREEESERRRSLSVAPDHSQSSQRSNRKQQRCKDPVLSATLRQLQHLGVDMDDERMTESERQVQQMVESSSTLASINPAAVVSRLSVSDPALSVLFPGDSVDLSLEANTIALRYLNDSQLSRLSLGGHAPLPGHTSSTHSLLSPSNMSVATRKYMRKYGLIEEEDEEEEEEIPEASARQPLTEAQNVKFLPQSQLIRDLRPKMQLLASEAQAEAANKENRHGRRPSLVRAGSRQTEGSVGNILDLSRLRQLPKLF